MPNEAVEQRVRALLTKEFGEEAGKKPADQPLFLKAGDPDFSSQELDSFDHVEFIMAIEENFDITIPDEDAQKDDLRTISGITTYVSSKALARDAL